MVPSNGSMRNRRNPAKLLAPDDPASAMVVTPRCEVVRSRLDGEVRTAPVDVHMDVDQARHDQQAGSVHHVAPHHPARCAARWPRPARPRRRRLGDACMPEAGSMTVPPWMTRSLLIVRRSSDPRERGVQRRDCHTRQAHLDGAVDASRLGVGRPAGAAPTGRGGHRSHSRYRGCRQRPAPPLPPEPGSTIVGRRGPRAPHPHSLEHWSSSARRLRDCGV